MQFEERRRGNERSDFSCTPSEMSLYIICTGAQTHDRHDRWFSDLCREYMRSTSAGRYGHVSQTTISNSKVQGCCSSFWVLIYCVTTEKPHQSGRRTNEVFGYCQEPRRKSNKRLKTRREGGVVRIRSPALPLSSQRHAFVALIISLPQAFPRYLGKASSNRGR